MHIDEVKDAAGEKAFIELSVRLYQGVKNWVQPLDKDVQEVFDPARNKMFRHGEAMRWLLFDGKKCVGRIAAFYDKRLFKPGKPRVGGLGFFECENRTDAAALLFQTAENWLKSKGIEAVDGAINFGDRDKNWGILVYGFDREPNYGMPYTHPYYPALFEEYGFKVYFNQLTFERVIMAPLMDKMLAKWERIKSDSRYQFFHWQDSRSEELIQAFTDVYNQAWSRHSGVPTMTLAHVKGLFAKLKPVLDKRLVWFGYHENRPVAFFLMLPELNQFFKHVHGKLDMWGKLRFAWQRYIVGTDKVFGVVFGVIPDFQGKGVEGAIIVECQKIFKGTGYKTIEMNWVGDFNPKMLHLMENLGAHEVKRHATYRLYFDRNYPFERHPPI